jgi:hypothetical protein
LMNSHHEIIKREERISLLERHDKRIQRIKLNW